MRKFFKYFFWIFSVIIMIMIFCLSSEPSEDSQATSEGFTEKVLMLFPSFQGMAEEIQAEIVEGVQFTVRKSAHFSIYCALGLSLYSAFLLTFSKKLLWLWAFGVSFLYSVSDEFHQYFVPGRSMELRDVLIDVSGAFLGILLVMLFIKIFKRK